MPGELHVPLKIIEGSDKPGAFTVQGLGNKKVTVPFQRRDMVADLIEATRHNLPLTAEELTRRRIGTVDNYRLEITNEYIQLLRAKFQQIGVEIDIREGQLRLVPAPETKPTEQSQQLPVIEAPANDISTPRRERLSNDPEVQSFIAWVNGDLPIDEAQQLKVSLKNRPSALYINEKPDSQIIVNLRNNAVIAESKEVLLKPYKDELYEWVEVYGFKNEEPRFVSYYRVTRDSPIKIQTWIGPVKQRYVDFLDNKIPFSSLSPLARVVQSNKLSLLRYKGKDLTLTIGDQLPTGTPLEVVPVMNEGNLALEVRKEGGEIFRVYVYDSKTLTFRIKGLDQKPHGYWTQEAIIEEAREYLRVHGNIKPANIKKDRPDLHTQIQRLPDGFVGVGKVLGLNEKPQVNKETGMHVDREQGRAYVTAYFLCRELGLNPGLVAYFLNKDNVPYIEGLSRNKITTKLYDKDEAERVLANRGVGKRAATDVEFYNKHGGSWTNQQIEDEARRFYQTTGKLTQHDLRAAGMGPLTRLINSYPGGFWGIKQVLGIESRQRNGGWIPEKIEQDATEFYQQHGNLSFNLLRQMRRYDLSSAIVKKYPGGLAALKEKLGITQKIEENEPIDENKPTDLEKLLDL